MNKKLEKLPPVGLRIVKSVLAVGICYLISFMRGSSGIVFYSHLAALWCIQTYVSDTKQKAKQRTIGTIVGAIYGLIVILIMTPIEKMMAQIISAGNILAGNIIAGNILNEKITAQSMEIISAIIITLMIGLVIYTTVCIHKNQASYFSCVVFLSIVVNHITDYNPYLFVLNRFLDTMIGIAVGMLVNCFELPRKREKDILFVSGLDDTLLNKNDNMSAFSRVELNRMIEEGALFTLSTERTPASILEVMGDIRLRVPVIAMDGAVLYDTREHRYLRSYVISSSRAMELVQAAHKKGISCFVNVIVEDMLVIYYEQSENEIYNEIMKKMRKSPYRNYVNRRLHEDEEVIYLMMIDQKDKIQAFYELLCTNGYQESFKLKTYESSDYKGYRYLKIYNKNASKEHMLKYLKDLLHVSKQITFGSIPQKYDVIITPGDSNKVVKTVKQRFEPVGKYRLDKENEETNTRK